MTPESALPLLDHAAQSSDRWLFLAALVIGLLGVGWLVRWLVGSYTGMAEKLSAVVQSNTDAMREVSDVMKRCRRPEV